MTTYYDPDIDLNPILSKRIAIVGFGAQGRSHAQNLFDADLDVVVALREDSSSIADVVSLGLEVDTLANAIASADIVMMLSPDGTHPKIYREFIDAHLKPHAMLMFAHGYNIHYQTFVPREDLDVVMVAPLGIGEQVRRMFLDGAGVPALLAIQQNASGQAKELALAYAAANGHGRAGVIETTFKEETETDLFAEQVVLCGGINHLIETAFDTLVEAGYQPELAYFSCLHELKLIIDLIYQRGIHGMRKSISEIAEYGDYTRGPRVINLESRKQMQAILEEIQKGEFAQEFAHEVANGKPTLVTGRAKAADHLMTSIGKNLRSQMTWLEGE